MQRGRKKIIQETDAEFIKSHATELTPLQMADVLCISERVISNYIRANGIKKTLRKPMGERKTPKGMAGFFNVHTRQNWLV
jgi:hypothetical protein